MLNRQWKQLIFNDKPTLSFSVCVAPPSLQGLDSDVHRNNRHGQWTTILVTAIAVGCVGLVVYVIMKKKRKNGIPHRTLVEENPSDQGMWSVCLSFNQKIPSGVFNKSNKWQNDDKTVEMLFHLIKLNLICVDK